MTLIIWIKGRVNPPMIKVISAKYGIILSRTACHVNRTRDKKGLRYFSCFTANSWLNDLEDIFAIKWLACDDTPSYAIGNLYQIWKESIQNWTCCRADKKVPVMFNSFTANLWWIGHRYLGQDQRLLRATHLILPGGHLCQICKESIKLHTWFRVYTTRCVISEQV